MSGRFFRSVSDSESESESEEELMSDSEEEQQQPSKTKATSGKKPADSGDSDESESDDDDSDDDSDDEPQAGAAPKKQSRFLRGADSDSDSEEEVKKVIKSAKDKRADEFEAIVKTIDNAQRIDDWVAISKEFDSLIRLCDRQKNVNEPVPVAFTRCLSNLDEFLNSSIAKDKSAAKKMKAPNAKAMNGMKQKLKKTLKDNEEQVARYRQDPAAFEAEANAASAPAPVAPKKKSVKITDDQEGEGEEDDGFETVGRGGRTMVITTEGLFKSLSAVMEARGRKSTDRSEQVLILTKLLGVAVSTYQKVRVLLALIAARFDYNASVASYMPLEMWSHARNEIEQLLKTLASDREYVVLEEVADYDEAIDRLPNQNGEGATIEVRGSIISFIDRLDEEFTKSLQNIDPHTTEYVERLRDEKTLYATIVRAQCYFEAVKQEDALSRTIMRRLEHVYAKQDVIIRALEASIPTDGVASQLVSKISPSAADVAEAKGPSALVRSLCVYHYRARGISGERFRTRAMLCHIYHHALHADYHLARDMFLMSHLQDTITLADAATQILYNRVVVQMGLCAFRQGLIRESQTALQDIFGTGRVKELLAQGVQRQNQYSTLTPEQEKLDRQRQLPFHMHINLELLECVYLVCSMLLEIPHMAYAGSDPELRKKIISRPFRRMLDYTDRQVFSGPPESTRDHVMQASKALQNGQWKECIQLVQDIKIWKLLPGYEDVLTMLASRIQEEGLKTYIFSYASYYNTVSLSHLAETFELSERTVRGLVSKLIWSEELAASLDPVQGIVVLHRVELTKVQQLAQTLAERANTMLEQNERLLDSKLGEHTRSGGPGDRADRGEGGGGRREGRRGGGSAGRGRGRGRGRAQFNALPGQAQRA